MFPLKLGLIGDNIARSQSPRLHALAGRLTGRGAAYDRLIPRDMGLDFDAVFDHCAGAGYRGVNVTYPYKERAAARVRVDDPLIRAMGAVNTVIFGEEGGPRGFNTDYSGFKGLWRDAFGAGRPGPVCLIGAGGVGKAIAFALLDLGVKDIRLLERDAPKAEALAAALIVARPEVKARCMDAPEAAMEGAEGVVNCTPIGMAGYPGTPMKGALMQGAAWAFDAVYTPADTQFLSEAAGAGLRPLSGYELFFHQGVDAWAIFSGGVPLDQAALRAALAAPATEAEAAGRAA